MSAIDQIEGPDEPDASKSIEGEGKGKSMEEKQPLESVSMLKQNETTPNGGKRKRKDWRAFASENGGARRRSLRSDVARLNAEAETGASRGTETSLNCAELEGVDSVKCGDDLQIAKGKVNKKSNECDVGSVSGKEVTKIGETGCLGNGKLGDGERKEGDDVVSGIAGSDIPAGKEVEELIDTKEKQGTELLDGTQPDGMADGGNGEELEGKGKGKGKGKSDNEHIECKTGEIDASCENSNSNKGIERESLKVEAGLTNPEGKGTAEAEEKKSKEKLFNNVHKELKRKGFTAKKRTPVQVESVIVERRITRSSAVKQKRNGENAPETEGATIVEGQMEEETSGLDQTDTDDNETLENLKLKKKKKKRCDRRKSLYVTDSDEEFKPSRRRAEKKNAKAESDEPLSSGTNRKPPRKRKRKKLKMDKEDSDEESEVVRRMDGSKKPELEESEVSGSSGSPLETLSKKKNLVGSDQETPTLKKRRGRLPGSKNKTRKAKFGKRIKKKEKRPAGSKKEEAVKVVESLSELDDKPTRVAKDLVSCMIKDLLKSHGWTIEMRPRYGRDYFDQVHVSPDGTTHWSITKAYYAFLQEMNSLQTLSRGRGKQVADFTPIPEELLGLLKRTVCKVRSDAKRKNKLKGKKKEKQKRLGVKSKKIKKKEKFKKKNKKKREKVSRDCSDETDADPGSTSKKSNLRRGRKKKARLTLLARSSHKEGDASGENDYVPYEWKRTVLSWMIDLDIVSENCKVKCTDPKKPDPLAEGKISRDGIECDCCGNTFTVSDFGVHAGVENVNSCLFVEEEEEEEEARVVCLLECLVQAWEKQCSMSEPNGFFLSAEAEGMDHHDDTCGICGDGGDLVCCDECPSTFHLGCLGMEMLPAGHWSCPYCSCAFCTKLPSSPPLLSCTQCSHRFHFSCVSEKNGVSVGQDDKVSFCGENCKKLFEGLEAILGVNNKMEGGFSWRLVRCIAEDESSLDPVHALEVRAECNSKIAVAMSVMDECFLPIDDERSGIDLLQNVVYSCKSNFVRLNFRGFYTFLLERADEIISVASVRVHGNKLAEMPFIGTRYMYRRQGMCRLLLDGIEMALSSLKVEKLIIPAITELVDTWTNVFGFRPLEGAQRQELRSKSIVVFPGTGLLQKPMLCTSSKADCYISTKEKDDEKLVESSKNQQFSNGDTPHEFADASCGDLKPEDSGEGSSSYATAGEEGNLAGLSKPDSHLVQSVEPDSNEVVSGKPCDELAEVDSDPAPAVQSQEQSAKPEPGLVILKSVTAGETKVLHGAEKMGSKRLGCGENGGVQGCAENGVHLTGAELASTDVVVMASAVN